MPNGFRRVPTWEAGFFLLVNAATSKPAGGARSPVAADNQTLRALCEQVVCAHGVVLLDLDWVGGARGPVLRATIDRPVDEATADLVAAVAAVTLDDCVRVSRDLSTALDAGELIGHPYSLEVSSPGLDRPLRQLGDFRRNLGKLAKCKLAAPAADGQRVLRGTIIAVEPEAIRMQVDGKEHLVALHDIREAKLVFALGDGAKRGGRTVKPRGNKTKGAPRRRSR